MQERACEMKVLLTKDVYKLGRAGDVKRVADGYGRNYLIPQGLALLATPGAMKHAERIRSQAEIQRAKLNSELKDLADQINGLTLTFSAKAGETGKMYGSITTQEIADAITEKSRYEVKRQQLEMQPIRNLGEYTIHVRLTMDLVPEVKVIVHREGEAVPTESAETEPEAKTKSKAKAKEVVEEVVAEEVIAEEVIVEEPVIEEAVPEELLAEEIVLEEPVAEEAVIEEPVAEVAVPEEIVPEDAVVDEVVTEEPAAEDNSQASTDEPETPAA
jgi:large subunit ribosomal protein L9